MLPRDKKTLLFALIWLMIFISHIPFWGFRNIGIIQGLIIGAITYALSQVKEDGEKLLIISLFTGIIQDYTNSMFVGLSSAHYFFAYLLAKKYSRLFRVTERKVLSLLLFVVVNCLVEVGKVVIYKASGNAIRGDEVIFELGVILISYPLWYYGMIYFYYLGRHKVGYK